MNDSIWDERRASLGPHMPIALGGRNLVLLWLAVFLLSVIYCELTAAVFNVPAVTLQVSCVWALQTWIGWMALSLFARLGAHWAVNTAASIRVRVACVMVGSVVGLAVLDTLGTWLLAALGLIEPIDVLRQCYLRAPRFLVGGVLLAAALEYVRWRIARSASPEPMHRAQPVQSTTPEAVPTCPAIRIATRTGELHLALSNVESVESAGNYVQIHLPDGKSFLHRATLKEMEAIAKPHGWQRIHRTALVNPAYVKSWANGDGVRLSSGRMLRIGRAYKGALDLSIERRVR